VSRRRDQVLRRTPRDGQESDRQVHLGLNAGLPLVNPKGGYYFVFRPVPRCSASTTRLASCASNGTSRRRARSRHRGFRRGGQAEDGRRAELPIIPSTS